MNPSAKFELGMQKHLRACVMYPPSRAIIQGFRQDGQAQQIRQTWETVGIQIGLYIHVPFCESKCAFCAYAIVRNKSKSDRELLMGSYYEAVLNELNLYAEILPSNVNLTGVDFGGGTPSLFSVKHFEKIIEAIHKRFKKSSNFEISVETTPKIAVQEPEKFEVLARLGIGRISMGVQSFDNGVLKISNRLIHHKEFIEWGAQNLRQSNIPIFNIDLMFALPGQTLSSWGESLRSAINLNPDIITTYDTVYKNRGIAAIAIKKNCLPTVDDFGQMYDMAYGILTGAGYKGDYGTVNFSKVQGRLGTSRYLEGRILHGLPYLGIGNYSSSLINNIWYFNELDIKKYLLRVNLAQFPVMDFYDLPKEDVIAKYLLLALSYGFIDKIIYRNRFGEEIEGRFQTELHYLLDNGLFYKKAERYYLMPGKFREMPGIRVCFYSDNALGFLKNYISHV